MTSRRRLRWTAHATILTVAMAAAAVALSGTADAQPCNWDLDAPQGSSSCTTQGTAFLNSGTLTMVAPFMLNWFGQVTGATQTLYDTDPHDMGLAVLDLRGLPSMDPASGWNITATATPFTGMFQDDTVPDGPMGSVLAFGGGPNPETASNVPSSVCATPDSCTPATTTLADYPIFIPTTVPVPVMIYNAVRGTGTGTVQIGWDPNSQFGVGNAAIWSVTLPGDARAEPYTSIITTTVAAGP